MKYLSPALAALMMSACASAPEILPFEVASIPVAAETDVMLIGAGDVADDPAIWVHASSPERTRILGTNKDEGLHVYDLAGTEVQFLDVGRVNNIDLRGNLAVASNDEVNGLSWFAIDDLTGDVSHLGDTLVEKVEPYGVCAGFVGSDYTAGVTYKDGTLELWRVDVDASGDIAPVLVRSVKLASQLEGCVFDDDAARLFIGEEGAGIWTLDLSDETSMPAALDMIANGNGLVADVEGLTLWLGEDQTGYLIASAQAADRFVVYDRAPPHAPRGIFTLVAQADGSVDEVTHTDGLDAVSAPLPGFPSGLLVVQDDEDANSGGKQNFKLISFEAVLVTLGL